MVLYILVVVIYLFLRGIISKCRIIAVLVGCFSPYSFVSMQPAPVLPVLQGLEIAKTNTKRRLEIGHSM